MLQRALDPESCLLISRRVALSLPLGLLVLLVVALFDRGACGGIGIVDLGIVLDFAVLLLGTLLLFVDLGGL